MHVADKTSNVELARVHAGEHLFGHQRDESNVELLPVPSSRGKGADGGSYSGANMRTLWLLSLVSLIEGADMQLLPATFKALEMDLGLAPEGLGSMSLAQCLFMSVLSPVWGVLADRCSRKWLMIVSCAAWGVLTQLLAMSTSVWSMIVLRCFHGATLASMMPVAQSVVADVMEPHQRGSGFGIVASAKLVGHVLAAMVATSMAGQTYAYGIRGWRIAFAMIALVSCLAAVLLALLMVEPPREGATPAAKSTAAAEETRLSGICKAECKRVGRLLRIRTFVIIVLQGLFGSVPWSALGFLTMYLQYCGHSDQVSAAIVSMTHLGGTAGSILGGMVGDYLARRSPSKGRPLTAVFSVLSGVPSTFLLIDFATEADASMLCALSFMLGLTGTWCGVACNRPILSEVVDSNGRASVIAWLTAMEGSSAALFGAPVVGYLAESNFGYIKLGKGMSASPEVAEANRTALRLAMLYCTSIPWLVCAGLNVLLCCTYGQSVKKSEDSEGGT